MSVVELHPDDLIDRSRRGELTPSERARLDAHLARCGVCRFEHEVYRDFAGEMEADELEPQVGLLVASALRSTAPQGDRERSVPKRSRSSPMRAALLLIAAAVTIAGLAGAAGWAGRALHFAPTTAPTPTESAPTGARQGIAPIPRPPPPAELPVTNTSAVSTLTEPPSKRPPATVARATANAPPAVSASNAGRAAELFEQANTARRSGDHATALARYHELQSQSPQSEEARISLITVGRLELDRGNASAALSSFDGYLRSGALRGPMSSELTEEAMSGRALALEKLGRADDESAAWHALLAAYPRSSYAAHARRRLSER